jgi:hypothetical protein
MKVHLTILSLAAALSLAACVAQQGTPSSSGKAAAVVSFTWETKGGGAIVFTAQKAGADYSMKVSQWHFQDADLRVTLTASSDKAFKIADGIFSGAVDLSKEALEDKGIPTGTWTSISLSYADGSKKSFGPLDLWGSHSLDELYKFVTTSIGD